MATPFQYDRDTLYCEQVPLADIAASAGTPCYVYSATAIREQFQAYESALAGIPHKICYAVKANSNLGLLALLAKAGAGFDIVSGGELYRVLRAGGDAASTVFSGVGKTAAEIEYALENGIHSFNCESEPELVLINALAGRLARRASVALRVNPDVDAATHPYISTGLSDHKFGIDIGAVEDVYLRARALENIDMDGVSCHIGSQLLDPAPLHQALDKMLDLVERLRARGFDIWHLDMGGGIGVPYKPTDPRPDIAAFVGAVRDRVAERGLFLMFEPGRSIVAEAGVLLTRVLYRKSTARKEFVVVDAAMNDLIRPSLYGSHHEIIPLRQRPTGTITADVVGPVCESGDFLAKNREMANVLPGDLLAVCTSGAYGFVSASNYNSRPRPSEVLVEGRTFRTVRRRETMEDLAQGESV
ncbi:MAG: diaminopimelate decarboxylase [Bryobacteraceae bacterium]